MHNVQHRTEPDVGVLYLYPRREMCEKRWEEIHADRRTMYDFLASLLAWRRYDERTGTVLALCAIDNLGKGAALMTGLRWAAERGWRWAVTMDADGGNKRVVFKAGTNCNPASQPDQACGAMSGVAFGPSWSPDGEWIAFGFGSFLQGRRSGSAKIMMVRKNGTDAQELTSGMPNAGFPSWSADGKEIVYRSWGDNEMGLRILNLQDRSVRVLTTDADNLRENLVRLPPNTHPFLLSRLSCIPADCVKYFPSNCVDSELDT